MVFFVGLCLFSCKPTEKGYQSAYDAAKGKREAALADMGVNLPEGAIQQVDGPQLKKIDGVEVYILNQRIAPTEPGKPLPENYNVAVGTYKMSTNCKAQAQALCAEGYDAFPAQEPDGMFFTIAGSFPNMQEAIKFYQEYSKKSDRVYVGLPNSPIIIYSPK